MSKRIRFDSFVGQRDLKIRNSSELDEVWSYNVMELATIFRLDIIAGVIAFFAAQEPVAFRSILRLT